jgi:hypothetical protein
MIIPSRVKPQMSSVTVKVEAGLDQYRAQVPPTPPFPPLLNTNALSFLWIEERMRFHFFIPERKPYCLPQESRPATLGKQ